MRFIALIALGLALFGCDSTVKTPDGDDGDDGDDTGRSESPIWGEGVETEAGVLFPVCIPVLEGCLRLAVSLEAQGSIVSGELVSHGCPAGEQGEVVSNLDGSAFTGHGTMWVNGDAELEDGTELSIEIEATQGDCSF
jgi:hypothetical protein